MSENSVKDASNDFEFVANLVIDCELGVRPVAVTADTIYDVVL